MIKAKSIQKDLSAVRKVTHKKKKEYEKILILFFFGWTENIKLISYSPCRAASIAACSAMISASSFPSKICFVSVFASSILRNHEQFFFLFIFQHVGMKRTNKQKGNWRENIHVIELVLVIFIELIIISNAFRLIDHITCISNCFLILCKMAYP